MEEHRERPEYDYEAELVKEAAHNRCRSMAGHFRNHDHRWDWPVMTTVTAKGHPAVLVPCASPYSAMLCAAEKWGVPWTSLEDVTVGDTKCQHKST